VAREELLDAVGGLMMLSWEGRELDEVLTLIRTFRPAGVIFFERNYPAGGPEALREILGQAQLTARGELGRPLLTAIDYEGGSVKRLPPPFRRPPAARKLAREGPQAVEAAAQAAAAELNGCGFNLNLAPVLDVGGADGPLGSRTFAEDPQAVAACGLAWLRGCRRGGALACGKHFPGLGPAKLDTHAELPTVEGDREKLAAGLAPFQALVAAGLKLIMTNHAFYPGLDALRPTTFSPLAVGLLKDDLGFEGLTLSDDLGMGAVTGRWSSAQAAAEAAAAGHDLLLVGRGAETALASREALLAAVEAGRLTAERLADARRRLERIWAALATLEVH
jgi:beta-N-acetylhexosaminidase